MYATGVTDHDAYKFCSQECKNKFTNQITFCGVCHSAIYKSQALENPKFGSVCSKVCARSDSMQKCLF